jgi:hypothetical protein
MSLLDCYFTGGSGSSSGQEKQRLLLQLLLLDYGSLT